MLRIRELDAGNVTGKNHAGFRGGHETPAIAAIRAVIQGAPGSARPNFKSTCRHGTEYGAGTRRSFDFLILLLRSTPISRAEGGRRGDILPSMSSVEGTLQGANRGHDPTRRRAEHKCLRGLQRHAAGNNRRRSRALGRGLCRHRIFGFDYVEIGKRPALKRQVSLILSELVLTCRGGFCVECCSLGLHFNHLRSGADLNLLVDFGSWIPRLTRRSRWAF